MFVRILTFALCLAVSGWALGPALAAKELRRDLSKEFEDLTPSEKIAIRAAAKVAYKAKKLQTLKVCADPGNMPFSNDKFEGLENKIANVLGEATGARVSFYWRPFLERAMTRQTFDAGMCDVMIDIPANIARPMSLPFAMTKASTSRALTIRSLKN